MQRLILTILMLGVLAACQSKGARENDPPVIDEGDCSARTLESGTCVPN